MTFFTLLLTPLLCLRCTSVNRCWQWQVWVHQPRPACHSFRIPRQGDSYAVPGAAIVAKLLSGMHQHAIAKKLGPQCEGDFARE
jgi:hypothetical protein